MYDRDVKAENKEQLDRLVQAIERLAEIHAKDREGEDNSNKELLDWLKKNNERTVKEVPASDDRAEVLKTVRRTNAAGGDGAQELDYSTISRINSMFRALQGDLGGFQRTIVSAVTWDERATKIVNNLQSITPGTTEGEITLKQAKKDLLGKLTSEKGGSEGLKEYFNQLAPDPQRIEYHRQWMSYDEAMEEAAQEKEDEILKRAKSQPRKKDDNGLLVPPPPGSSTGMDVASLAKVATTVALTAAPIVAGKMINAMANSTIEGNRQYQMLNANLATDYAMFNQKNLITDMKYARNISPAMQQLLQSEAAFNSTMEPIKSLGTSMSSSVLSGAVDAFELLAKPISAVAKAINGTDNKAKALQEEAMNKAGLGSVLGAIGGGIAGFFAGGPLGAIGGAAWGAGFGAAGGAAIGIAGEAIGEARKKELDRIIGNDPNDTSKKGMIGMFANELVTSPICPPRKFVP
ncbi:MAG TPA: hypothetical protein PLN21_09460 [Gemmatales bacterium]|nr:hypothetical protein [Gemmatales bacterium]